MSARDDYPVIAVHARWPGDEGRQCKDALDEIDRLRAQPPHPSTVPRIHASLPIMVSVNGEWVLIEEPQ